MCFIYILCGKEGIPVLFRYAKVRGRKRNESINTLSSGINSEVNKNSRMDPEQIILDEDFDDGSTDGGYGEYDYLQQDKDALPVTPLELS